MNNKIITAFFSDRGIPAEGLTPAIRIRTVADNTVVVGDDPANPVYMTELGDGFYKYDFVDYDSDQDYLMLMDGGDILTVHDRFQVAANVNYADDVWDENTDHHNEEGSFGDAFNKSSAATADIQEKVTLSKVDVEICRKHLHNRTYLSKEEFTLTIFEDDGITPFRVFELRDSMDRPSIYEIVDRIPRP